MLEQDPHALDAAMKDTIPTTAQLIEAFPELASVAITDIDIDGPHGPIPARSYRAPGAPSSGLMWVHGGAFIFGDLDMLESHWVALSIAARGTPVFAVDYRKALSGVHFPVPSDDVLAAWIWIVEQSQDVLGVYIRGGSAGANLASGVAKRLRDSGGAMPASLVLAYGVFHAELPELSDELVAALANHPEAMEFPADFCRKLNLRYVGSEAALADPYAFAANGDNSGLPPTYLLNSEADYLRASGDSFAELLRDAGVELRHEFEPGTTHGHLNEAFDPAATRSIDRIIGWLGSTAEEPYGA